MEYYLKNDPKERKIAYFSLEIGLSPEVPTYSGGLGILAGDTIKSFADLNLPCVAVTLLYEKGYFHQEIDELGNQKEVPVNWDKSKHMRLLPNKVNVRLEGRDIMLQAWVYEVKGIKGSIVPVIFLDSNIEANNEGDRSLTSYLYGGDRRYRLMQEALLGIGGPRMLRSIGHDNLVKFHMNEGHAALLTLELMNRFKNDLEEVREACVFTTHTPVPAGHDSFEIDLARSVLRDFCNVDDLNHDNIIDHENKFNMTYLALHHANYVNGVAKKHGEVSRKMFPGYSIESITNGVHAGTWVSEPFAKLFDNYIKAWKTDNYNLRYALNMPSDKIWETHQAAKKRLIEFVNQRKGTKFKEDILTIGFARRAATYKRADLIFRDIKRLLKIHEKAGKFHIIFAGKAHPADGGGKDLIKKIHEDIKELKGKIEIVYLENYEMFLGGLLTSGVDVWLNNPMRPREASGTSGMKAAMNGVPSFSVLDGWWLEGHVEEMTGWSIGPRPTDVEAEVDESKDIEDLYEKLEKKIIPCYYRNPDKWKQIMKYSIAFNGSFFNTQRMVSQYVMNAYFK
ncbi:MAG: alpha-glucan family phosphorylase [Candidatus Woesearchaeota archaeon]